MRRVALIVAAGVVVRLLLLLVVDPSANAVSGDAAYYAAGHLDGYRMPLYALFLNATLPFGLWLPLVSQSCLTIGAGVASRNFWTGLLIAACPFFALADFMLLSESLYIAALWLGWIMLQRGKGLGAGALVGAAMLTNDILLLLPFLAALVFRTRPAIIMAAIAYAMVLPWLLYAGVPTRSGLNLWVGTWEREPSWYAAGMYQPTFPPEAFASSAEKAVVTGHWIDDKALRKAAFDRIASRPLQTTAVWVGRFPRLWIGTRSAMFTFRAPRFGMMWTAEKSLFWGLNLVLLLFGLWGLSKPDWFLAFPPVYIAAAHMPFHAEMRYTLAALPFLIALGCRQALIAPKVFHVPGVPAVTQTHPMNPEATGAVS